MPRRGSILILVMFVLSALSLLALSFAYRAGLESRTSRNRAVYARLKSAAYSTAAVAISRIKHDRNDYDHPSESWATVGQVVFGNADGQAAGSGAEDDGTVVAECHVADAEGKLHVSFAPGESLAKLGMTTAQVASLSDWIDADGDVRSEGAEDEYYGTLPVPYRCKNGPLATMDELMLVRGFAAAGSNAVAGGDTTKSQTGDGAMAHRWDDLLRCVGTGRINLNTAPLEVLQTLPLSRDAATQIASFRTFDANASGTPEDHAFKSERDIEQLQGLTEPDKVVLSGIATFTSTHFRIRVRATHRLTGLRYRLEASVRRNGEQLEVTQWKAGG